MPHFRHVVVHLRHVMKHLRWSALKAVYCNADLFVLPGLFNLGLPIP